MVVSSNPIEIGGFVPLTTIDFPHHLSAVIFCQGCPYRCHYCHNPDLIPRKNRKNRQNNQAGNKFEYSWQKIKDFLLTRVGLLEAVVFSGGEPTLQAGLLAAIIELKDLGFKIGLHTAGSYPNRLKQVLPYIDWVGMDIKAPFDLYPTITTIPKSGQKALDSAKLVLASGVEYEFRTTVHPALLNPQQVSEIKDTLTGMGATVHKIQQFRAEGCVNEELNNYPLVVR
jgi:anaerobic ribonucleoside-triphosphate reductase activating protein